MQFRRGTAARLTAANEVLLAGQPCLNTDTRQIKVGDGVSRWVDLPYLAVDAADVVGLGDLAFISVSGDSADFLDGTGAFVPIPGVSVPAYAPGDTTVANGNYMVMASELRLPGADTMTLEGDATLRIV